MSDYLSNLSKPQREAVENFEGPSLIIAGAGSGKTRVLTYRIAYMIEQGVAPSSILALTFTKKAATEMRERISTVVPRERTRGLWMGTFHALFARILRVEAEALKFSPSFTIYETSDSRNVVKTIIKELNLDDTRYKPKDIFTRISLAKNNLMTPAMYRDNTSLITEDRERGIPRFNEIYTAYMIRCRQNGAMDFDDLLLYTNILFKEHPDILEKYQDIFRYILVDEYQDTNLAQYLIIKKLSAKHRNICVVGDDAQSIYSFRGARIENILRFQQDYQDAAVYKLEENYRSTQNIVNAANCVIKKNKNQLDKKVFSNKQKGEKIQLCRAESDKEEARQVVVDMMRSHNGGVDFKDMAILYRTNAQSRAMEDALRLRAIPYRIYGGMSFYQRAEVKNVIAYIRLIVNRHDDEALKRIINFPVRGIGATTLGSIETAARGYGLSMWDAIMTRMPEELGIRDAAMKKVRAFTSFIEEMREISLEVGAYELVFAVCQRSGMISAYKDNPAPESQSAYQNIEELVNSVKQQADSYYKENGEVLTSARWLEDITLLSDMDRDEKTEDAVTLMTIHSAKGLEFSNIYIVGVEEGLFPSIMSMDDVVSLEEERRLFYVAITRAINRLMISYSMSRFKWGSVTSTRPSPFLKDIDPEFYDNPELASFGNTRIVITDDESEVSPRWGAGGRQGYRPSYDKTPSREPNLKKVPAGSGSGGQKMSSHGDIKVGSRVRHSRFGEGVVESLEAMGNDIKALIIFDKEGKKNMLLKFARLEVLD